MLGVRRFIYNVQLGIKILMRFLCKSSVLIIYSTIHICAQSSIQGRELNVNIFSSRQLDGYGGVYKPQTSILLKKQASPSVRFIDPIPDGSTTFPFTISNYVDHDSLANSVKDYNCASATYDGHQGTDFDIVDFYAMDEGSPVQCAAAGVVYSVHDGSFDRNSVLNVGDTSNSVTIIHSDGSYAAYLHFKKNTIRVKKGQSVNVGDTLGMIGSSGYSTGPHLHFEVGAPNGDVVDPFTGPCQSGLSLWQMQYPYEFERKTEVLTHGLTVLPMSRAVVYERPPSKKHFTAGDTIKSWIKVRNSIKGDSLIWIFTMPNALEHRDIFTVSQSFTSSWWYTWYYPFQTETYFGKWHLSILCNNKVVVTDSFSYDTELNKMPSVDTKTITVNKNQSVLDSLTGIDSDGGIFWYRLSKKPVNGILTQSGGRNRKIMYTPSIDFLGTDTAYFYAIDDENDSGAVTPIVFNVQSSLAVYPQAQNKQPCTVKNSSDYATVSFRVTKTELVVLDLYDIQGKYRNQLLDKIFTVGMYNVKMKFSTAARGVHVYRLRIGNKIYTGKTLSSYK